MDVAGADFAVIVAERPLGLTVEETPKRTGMHVTAIAKKGAIRPGGRVHVGDVLVKVGDVSVMGKEYEEGMGSIKKALETLPMAFTFRMKQCKRPGCKRPRHSVKTHGYCCGRCRVHLGHGHACEYNSTALTGAVTTAVVS